MKYLVLCLSFLLYAAAPLQAQNKKALKAALASDLERYRQYSLQLNLDSLLAYMPPQMFEIIPKDTLAMVMRQSMINEYMRIDLTGFEYKGQPKIKKAGDYFWAHVPYDGAMKLRFNGESAMFVAVTLAMEANFGKKNVRDIGDKTLEVFMPDKQMIAIKDPGLPNWSFIEDKRGVKGENAAMQEYIFERVVPEEVRKAMGKKK